MSLPSPWSTPEASINGMAKDKDGVKSFVLRVDAGTMDALERWAADEFRSINGQLLWIINEALRKSKRLPPKNGGKA